MPYTFRLARRFGYATNYAALRHPSLPNYIAIANGETYGISNDDRPSVNPVRGRSVFGQALASGKTAAVFVDEMPRSCATIDGGSGYAVKHNPWAYVTDERDLCQKRRPCGPTRCGDQRRLAAEHWDGCPEPLPRLTRPPSRHCGCLVRRLDDRDLRRSRLEGRTREPWCSPRTHRPRRSRRRSGSL